MRNGNLSVVERLPGSQYRCLCDCGEERIVNVGHFNTGKIKSCGCHVTRHGHGGQRSRTYICYHNMLARCHKPENKRYDDYGGKGIVVCDRWRESFTNFLEDMGECPPGLTIDRIDNSKGYEPGNCRWATRRRNQRNRDLAITWIVDRKAYETAADAASVHGVSGHTIRAWCMGRRVGEMVYPRKVRCRAYRTATGEDLRA